MEVKKYDISMPKINYKLIELSIINNGEATKIGDNDLLYLTVRETSDTKEIMLQKGLNNGITYNSETGKYEIEIMPEDTKNFATNKKYGYDITLYLDGTKPKQKVIGKFIATDQFTRNGVM